MQVIFQTQEERFEAHKVFETITVRCDDNGVERFYTFENTTATQALHNICALYTKNEIKTIYFKNYKK